MTVQVRPQRIPMSREEFDRLPEGPPYFDYVNGEAVDGNRPTGRHQQIEMRLGNLLWEHAHAQGLGEVFPQIDVELPSGLVVGPDLVFIATERLGGYDEEKGDFHGSPDLVVEVLSPSTASYDRVDKFQLYHRSRVGWVWFIDPGSFTIEEYQWTADGYLWRQAVGPGQVFMPTLFPELRINLQALMGKG